MASIIVNFLESHIRTEDFEIISGDVAIVKKRNWDYLEALAFKKLRMSLFIKTQLIL